MPEKLTVLKLCDKELDLAVLVRNELSQAMHEVYQESDFCESNCLGDTICVVRGGCMLYECTMQWHDLDSICHCC